MAQHLAHPLQERLLDPAIARQLAGDPAHSLAPDAMRSAKDRGYSIRPMPPNDLHSRRVSCVHLLPATEQAGAETRARELLQGLARTGRFNLELAYFRRGRAHPRFEELGLPLRDLKMRARLALDLPGVIWRLRSLYSNRPPHIFHTWLIHGNVVGLLAARAWPDARVIITQSGGEEFYPWHLRVQRALLGRADHAISNSSDGAAVLERLGMPAGKISVVANGIAPERVGVTRTRGETRAQLRVPASTELVVVCTRANYRLAVRKKNFAGLLAALELVRQHRPATTLLLVGPTRDELGRFGIALPRWAQAIGFVDRPADYMAAADVVAIPSNAEGTSNVACEALMLGLPVATTAVGDHVPIVVEAGGKAVPVGDPRALADALIELLEQPPSPERVGAVAERRLGLDRMVRSTAEIYDEVLAASPQIPDGR